MWGKAFFALGGWVYEIFKGRQEVAKAKAQSRIKQAERWEEKMTDSSMSSLKDEFWSIVLALPMILCFKPGMVEYVVAGFEALEKMPEWYRWSLLLSIGASFGFRGVDKFNFLRGSK